jgi:hypothetical protein
MDNDSIDKMGFLEFYEYKKSFENVIEYLEKYNSESMITEGLKQHYTEMVNKANENFNNQHLKLT